MYHYDRWRHLIQAAKDEDGVSRVIGEYAHSILPSDIASLPPRVHQILARPDEDIVGHAVELVRLELAYAGSAEAGLVLHQIATTFIAASNRLAQLPHRDTPAQRT